MKGVGPKIAELFQTKEISTAGDLLRYFPYKYLDRRSLSKISELQPGKDKVIAGKILACGMAFAGRRKIFEIVLGDGTGTVSLKWFRFNPRHMMGSFKKDMGLIASGEATRFRNQTQFIHPILEIIDADVVDEIAAPGIIPVYSQIQGLGQKLVRKVVANSLRMFQGNIEDPLPPEIRERLRLPHKEASLQDIHFPEPATSLETLVNHRTPAFKREIFEEFFFMELGLALKRKTLTREKGQSIDVPEEKFAEWETRLPFRLTGAQRRVLKEIADNLREPHPMNRLVQGDVGSGKTVVAMLAAMAAIEKGYQAALMAPTEILAAQHYKAAQKLFAPFKIPVALLTGSLDASEKKRAHGRIAKGMFPFVVGTHALVAEKLAFKSLGLVIIDEQHRFGVLQRATLKEKGDNPHVLVMTATPIPRTLAMTIYGDLDLSVIDEMPPGRQAIRTRLVGEKARRQLYAAVGEILSRGDQGYIVYPLIEESEKLPLRDATRMYEEIRRIFPRYQVALLHGKTPQDEKDAVMRSFKAGDIHLLISTTVIEVGIDVPNATLMVIEHAERFGLSQLHQLRGRVGRGDKPSHCLLVTGLASSNPGFRRLEVMCETADGFKIAEEDLKIRGPGDFLGTRQSGLPELRVANLIRDYKILEVARQEAFAWLERDPTLSMHAFAKETLRRRWGEKLALADIG
ncbi:MAG TPA: ATP-dependent DNA helicase RecG [bacterium]|nr:ATP-dependent DNA helicase RecG [bacterium]